MLVAMRNMNNGVITATQHIAARDVIRLGLKEITTFL
jgi:hypothetical protein